MSQRPTPIPLTLLVDEYLCKGCGYCVDDCPKDVLVLNSTPNARGIFSVEIAHPEKCIQCRQCELVCPEMAIYLEPTAEEAKPKEGCEI